MAPQVLKHPEARPNRRNLDCESSAGPTIGPRLSSRPESKITNKESEHD